MSLNTTIRLICIASMIYIVGPIAHFAHAQSVGDGIVVSNVNDWGSGHIATFQYTITPSDVSEDRVRDWRLEVLYSGDGDISGTYMSGYNGTVSTGESASDNSYYITNEGVGYRPELEAGEILTFNIQVQGAGYIAEDYSLDFINLTALPTNTFSSDLVSVNDWYNPAWGGGFNATFLCTIGGVDAQIGPVTDLLVEFNYSGTGTPSNAWTQSHNGPVVHGFIAPDGGYAISNLEGFQPELFAGDTITFAVQVQNAAFNEDDFDVICSSGGNMPSDNTAPFALPQSVEVFFETPYSLILSGTDVDGDSLIYQVVDGPEYGVLTGTAPTLQYTPKQGFSGNDSFTFTVNDGSEMSESATVSLLVSSPINQPPIAQEQAVSLSAESDLSIELTGIDEDNDNLTFEIVSQPTNGTLSGTAPDIVYTPDPGFTGSDEFTFTVNDSNATSIPARVLLEVLALPNTAPTADAGDAIQTDVNTLTDVQGMGIDAEDDLLSYRWILLSKPPGSALNILSYEQASFSFVPDLIGIYEFQLVVNDGELNSDPDIVQISAVEPAMENSAPIANAGEDYDVPSNVNLTLIGTGYDPDGDELTYSWTLLSSPSGSRSQPTQILGGVAEFRPDIEGSYRLGLTVNDGQMDSQVDIVQIEASSQNSPPIASATFSIQGEETDQVGYRLDASASFDADYLDDSHEYLSYTWTVLEPTDTEQYQLYISPGGEDGNSSDGYRGFIEVSFDTDVVISVVASDGYQDSEPFILEIPAGSITPPVVAVQSTFTGNVADMLTIPIGVAELNRYGDILGVLPLPDTYEVSIDLVSRPPFSTTELSETSLLIQRLEPPNLFDIEIEILQLEQSPLRYENPELWQAQYEGLLARFNGAIGETSLIPDRIGRYMVRVTVDNMKPQGKSTRLVEIRVERPGNQLPIASISPSTPQTVIVDDNSIVVNLDGSSSSDPDGDPLTYQWTISDSPYSSRAYINNSQSPLAELVIDRRGTYTLSLIVDDGQRLSDKVSYHISAEGSGENGLPIAVTGVYATVPSGTSIQLDGHLSTDPDGDSLSYQWRNVSSAELQNASVYQRSDRFSSASVFVRDPGEYTFELIVSDWADSSEPERVTVSVTQANRPPEAVIGFTPRSTTTVEVGEFLSLNAEQSYDRDDDVLSYQWKVTRTDGTEVQPQVPDDSQTQVLFPQAGEYIVQLLVSDGEFADMDIARVSVFAIPNQAPVTVFPSVISADINESVVLDGTGSYDPDGDRRQILMPYVYRSPNGAQTGSLSVYPLNVDSVELEASVKGVYVLGFSHSDSFSTSETAVVRFAVGDPKPTAKIFASDAISIGDEVVLSGASSTDSNGNSQGGYLFFGTSVDFQWRLVSRPSASMATLSSESAVEPTLVLDAAGDYVFELIVEDFHAASSPTTLAITVEGAANGIPVAVANGDPNGEVGVELVLSGGSSSDPDSEVLTYQWTITSQPIASMASLGNAQSEAATLVPDIAGTYVIELIVGDGTDFSMPDSIVIDIVEENGIPIASAGEDISGEVGVEVSLVGNGSSDPDGDSLTFEWSIVSQPEGSIATLTEPLNDSATLIPDMQGDYVIALIVSDAIDSSTVDTVVVSVSQDGVFNSPPIAEAGYDQNLIVGTEVRLMGGLSYDADPADVLEYTWMVDSKPVGSTASIVNYTSGETSVRLDLTGTYQIRLDVSDGKALGSDSVTFTVVESTVDLPDDPGPFSHNSLLGLDNNQNGVRDDVERFISAHYRSDVNLQKSLYQLAAGMRTVFTHLGNEDRIGDALSAISLAYECYYSVTTEDDRGDEADYIVAEMVNTETRLSAFYEFGTSIEGRIHVGNRIDQWLESCDFEVQP